MSLRAWTWVLVVSGLCLTLLASRLLPYDVYLALVGVLVGALISGAISWYIYQRSSDELRKEAEALREETERLRRHTTLIMRGLEEFAKTGNLKWNLEEAEHIGIAFERSASDHASVSDSEDAKLEAPPEQE